MNKFHFSHSGTYITKKIILHCYHILNFIIEKCMKSFLSHCRSIYIRFSVLPFNPQSLKYLLSCSCRNFSNFCCIYCPHFTETEPDARSDLPQIWSFLVSDGSGVEARCSDPPLWHSLCRIADASSQMCYMGSNAVWAPEVGEEEAGSLSNLVPKCGCIIMVLNVMEKHRKGGPHSCTQIWKTTPVCT